jgi:hypothetical protein
MRFSHCLLPSNVRGPCQAKSKSRVISAIWVVRQQESQKYCCVKPSWLEMRRHKHKVVTIRDRRGVEAQFP